MTAKNSGKIKCVTLEWLKDSVKSKNCLRADKYPPNMHDALERAQRDYGNSMSCSLFDSSSCSNLAIENIEKIYAKNCSSIDNNILSNYHFYIHGFNGKDKKILRNIITDLGGFFYETQTPNVTHIIVANKDSENSLSNQSRGFFC